MRWMEINMVLFAELYTWLVDGALAWPSSEGNSKHIHPPDEED